MLTTLTASPREFATEMQKQAFSLYMKRSVVSFDVVFDQVVAELTDEISASQTIIEADFSEAPQVIFIDTYVHNILSTLISNAIRYRHADRSPYIRVRSYFRNRKVYLEVSDNGSGIDLQQNQNQVFGLFKTFHAGVEARGLGLFIVRTQVESMRGNISVQSLPGQGSSFTVQF